GYAETAAIGAQGYTDRPLWQRPLQRRRHPPGVARIELRHRGEPEPQIADAPRQRPLHRHDLRRNRPLLGGARIEARHPAEARTDTDKAAGIGGIADRAADIIAVRDG